MGESDGGMKRTQKETQRGTIHSLPILPGTLVLCACTLIVFLGVMAAMYGGGMLEMPQFLSNILGDGDGDDADDGFLADFIASLSARDVLTATEHEAILDTSPESLRTLLLAAEPPETYLWTAEVIRTDGKVFRTETVRYLVDGERVCAEIYPSNGYVRRIVADDLCAVITENGASRRFSRTGEYDTFTPEGEAGLPSLSRMKAMIAEADEGKYELSLEVIQNASCIRVSFTDTLSGVKEVYDVLPDFGIVYAASSCLPDSDTPYFQLTTTSVLTDITGMDETLFASLNP